MTTKAVDAAGDLVEIRDIEGLSVRSPVDAEAPVTQAFGVRSVTGIVHRGIDLGIPSLTAVRAVADGGVTYTYTSGRDVPGLDSDGSPGGYGNQVRIAHDNGIESRYAHLATVRVRARDRVRAGTIVGSSGSTGISTGPHLHWELRRDDMPFDPAPYVRQGDTETEEDQLTARYTEEQLKMLDKLLTVPAGAPADARPLIDGLFPLALAAARAGFVASKDAETREDAVSRGIRRVGRLVGVAMEPAGPGDDLLDQLRRALSRDD